jgi:hypothetical protein
VPFPNSATDSVEDRQDAQHDLKIAWQYQKYLGGSDLGEQGTPLENSPKNKVNKFLAKLGATTMT